MLIASTLKTNEKSYGSNNKFASSTIYPRSNNNFGRSGSVA